MANMSYCRFENTLTDLRDCQDNLEDAEGLSESEAAARKSLIETCQEITAAAADEGWGSEEEN